MDPINRENEFTKVSWHGGMILIQVKSRFLKFGFNYYTGTKILSSSPLETSIPVTAIKKLKIQGTKPVTFIFFLFAALAFGLGFLNGQDPITGEITGPSGSHIATGTIIALILVALGLLFMKSKTGRLKYLFTSYEGTPFVIYGSLDKDELIQLRQAIQNKVAPG